MLGEQSIETEAFQIPILEPDRYNVGRLEGFVGKADRSDGQLELPLMDERELLRDTEDLDPFVPRARDEELAVVRKGD